MTEEEWLESVEPRKMLAAVALRASSRKLRWFACACCRRVWQHLEDARSRAAIEEAERYADGGTAKDALSAAQLDADRAVRKWPTPLGTLTTPEQQQAWAAAAARYAAQSTDRIAKLAAIIGVAVLYALFADSGGSHDTITTAGRKYQADLLRDIFGNPFRSTVFSPDWRTDTVLTLARTMYESRHFGAMPILADALQDAGCDDEQILAHCRGEGPHVRGCWVVDLVLGKE